MSIVAIRKMTEKKGCQVLMALIGILLALGMVTTGMFGWGDSTQASGDQRVAFTVGDLKVTQKQLSDRINQFAQAESRPRGNPGSEVDLVSRAIGSFVQEKAQNDLAREVGASVSETNVRQLAESYADEQWERQKIQLLINGTITPGQSEKEADDAMAKAFGRTRADFKKQFADEAEKHLNDPETRSDISSALLPLAISKKYEETTPYTEQQLRESFREYKFDVIRFEDPAKPIDDRENEALKALDDIRAGGDFAAIQKQYNPNATAEDRTASLNVGLLESDQSLAPLRGLKQGEVSDVIMQAGSPVIFRLNAIEESLPADYEQSKEALLAQKQKAAASQAFSKASEEKFETLKPKFTDLGLELTFETYELMTDQQRAMNLTAFRKDLESQLDKIQSADLSTSVHSDLVSACEYMLTEAVFNMLEEAEKKDYMEQRLEAADRMFEFYDDPNIRTALARDLLNYGFPDDAARYAIAAIEVADYDEPGQQLYATVTEMVKSAGDKFNEDQRLEIQSALDKWLEAKVQIEKEEAELEEERRKAQEELDSTVVEPKTEGDEPAESSTSESSGE